MTEPRYRPTPFGLKALALEREPDGTLRARSTSALSDYPVRLSDRLAHWAALRGGQTFAAKRGPDGQWRHVTWAQALGHARRLGQALLDRGLSVDRPLIILSDNDLEHLMLILAAQHVGVAYASISQAYSLISQDHGKLRHIVKLMTPGLVFAAHGERFAKAIAAAVPEGIEIAVTQAPIPGRACVSWDALDATPPTAAVDTARLAVGPDTVQKFLFTSGSTSLPKAVVNTERMVCSQPRRC
jgi:feruloyl-CoA synthase